MLRTVALLGGRPESIFEGQRLPGVDGGLRRLGRGLPRPSAARPDAGTHAVAVANFIEPMLIEIDCVAYRVDG